MLESDKNRKIAKLKTLIISVALKMDERTEITEEDNDKSQFVAAALVDAWEILSEG